MQTKKKKNIYKRGKNTHTEKNNENKKQIRVKTTRTGIHKQNNYERINIRKKKLPAQKTCEKENTTTTPRRQKIHVYEKSNV